MYLGGWTLVRLISEYLLGQFIQCTILIFKLQVNLSISLHLEKENMTLS